MSARTPLLIVFLVVFIDLLGFGMVLPLLPLYAEAFAQQLGLAKESVEVGLLIGLLMSSFSLMQFIFAPQWGRLSDRIGRRPVLLIGLAGSVVFYTMFGIASVVESLALLFVSRIGAGIAGATISTAHAYIADSTTLENRTKGMALVGAAFGLGFTFGPLFGWLAIPSGKGDPGPGPGYAAAALSAVALLLACFRLPESLKPGSASAVRRLFDLTAFRAALATPSIGLLLLTSFVCVFSFANFESTLALMIENEDGAFRFSFGQVMLTFAYIGFVLTLVQGGVVRRLAGAMDEGKMASGGAVVEVAGFVLLGLAHAFSSLTLLLVALAVVVSGFAFMTPSLNSLISRRSDPAIQGGILGLGQSASSLARILGPACGVPLLKINVQLPIAVAAVLMSLGLAMIQVASRRGSDFPAAA